MTFSFDVSILMFTPVMLATSSKDRMFLIDESVI